MLPPLVGSATTISTAARSTAEEVQTEKAPEQGYLAGVALMPASSPQPQETNP
jgi:hypothetical protein